MEEWWFAIKLSRVSQYKQLSLLSKEGEPFVYAYVDAMAEMLHFIDMQAAGTLQGKSFENIITPQTQDRFIFKSLVEESITSSQLEGAVTTRKVAQEMLYNDRKPRDRSEQMIYNNYLAMQYVKTKKGKPLTPALLLELQQIVTYTTLDDPEASGRFRVETDDIHVVDHFGTILHTPPSSAEIADRVQKLCDFANGVGTQGFIHPVIRAIFAHFWLAYDHPFVDGNGRTARALFYWSMISQGYWLAEYIPISHFIKKAPVKYGRAFLYTETDGNDATYFMLNQLGLIVRAIESLHEYLSKKVQEWQKLQSVVQQSDSLRGMLNHRQIALLNNLLKNPDAFYTVESHKRAHHISYQTARTDLLEMERLELLSVTKQGKAMVFWPKPNISKYIQSL